MDSQRSFYYNLLQLNLGILCISTSGVLGRFIALPIPVTIASRALMAGLLLYLYCRYKKLSFTVQPKDLAITLLGGVLFGLHWITYFYALRLSNVAVGMLSLFTYPIITALLEPVFRRQKILRFHLLLGVLLLTGIYFLVPAFSFENQYFIAILFGIASAFCYSLRNILMKPLVLPYNGSVLMVYQVITVGVLLSPVFFVLDTSEFIPYLPYTVLLAVITTALGHTLFLYSFKYFSVATASIISCLQPVYGVLLGLLFLKEYPEPSTLIGGVLIVSSVVLESRRIKKQKT